MKRGSLFFIGLLSAIVTITSLHFAMGRFYYDSYAYKGYHHCYHDRYNDKDHSQNQHRADSSVNY